MSTHWQARDPRNETPKHPATNPRHLQNPDSVNGRFLTVVSGLAVGESRAILQGASDCITEGHKNFQSLTTSN